ncbi:hypothetical protein KBZ10_17985 [Streptomyces sp. F63]|uniref:hypothetical protein n=1 Tax=Streptomyces sp. F63 TaxID=2824887 RepID=UPI001B35B2B0|nr:hypothetical protein [Streptomyces sp. F63]MBQ0986366.1 hypothetical protein [Streptomyces sp. F63]
MSEAAERGTRLRRLPWSNDADRPSFVESGDSFLNRLADTLEGQMIETAQDDADKARDLVADPDATAEEMRKALGYLAGSLRDAALVATLRGERLNIDSAPAGESHPADEPLYGERARAVGQALRMMRPGRGQ